MKTTLVLVITSFFAFAFHTGAQNLPTAHNDWTVAQLQAEMKANKLSSEQLTREYLARIAILDQDPNGVNAIIELNPDAIAMAKAADKMRRAGRNLGPLHGIPV